MCARRYIDDPALNIMGSYRHDISYLSPAPIDPDGLYIQVHRAGAVARIDYSFNVERDDSYEYNVIHCIFRGKGTVTVRGQKHVINGGSIFVLASNEAHSYETDPKDPMGIVWVEFAGGGSTQLMKHILDSGGPVHNGGIFGKITELCTSILSQPAIHTKLQHVSSILYEVLMQLCAHVESGVSRAPMANSILKYIDDNFRSRITLSDISAYFGYHPAYFSALFSKEFGVTFSKYIMNMKLQHARHLLETTEWSIDRISRELGFYDVSHFSQRFRAAEGMTPTAYRQHKKTTV